MPVSFVDRQMSNDHREIGVLQRSASDLDSIILRPTSMAPWHPLLYVSTKECTSRNREVPGECPVCAVLRWRVKK